MDNKNIMTWASYAAVGDRIVYHIDDGRFHSRAMGKTFASAWDASCRGLVFLCQRRVKCNEGERLQYMAIRISSQTAFRLGLITRAEAEVRTLERAA